ncbi:unnamed protein product [Notodromas monacha]|uniref:Tyrosine--tRNA ligase n=1 Tax=Notodromas monacha TaxID=399045 RepID=A0A7R9GHB1_9CRUS|nr:unnamed protein product [Notodromas monacha]CAG0920729.1 unnamed protein product [Notodromas monacha]
MERVNTANVNSSHSVSYEGMFTEFPASSSPTCPDSTSDISFSDVIYSGMSGVTQIPLPEIDTLLPHGSSSVSSADHLDTDSWDMKLESEAFLNLVDGSCSLPSAEYDTLLEPGPSSSYSSSFVVTYSTATEDCVENLYEFSDTPATYPKTIALDCDVIGVTRVISDKGYPSFVSSTELSEVVSSTRSKERPGKECTICGRSFSRLDRHVKAVHGDKKTVCHCDDKPKPVSVRTCRFCGETFNKYSILRSHIRMQHPTFASSLAPSSNIPPCKYCGRKFSSEQKLRDHTTAHSGKYRYQCDMCDKGFAVVTDLQRHRRTHTAAEMWSWSVRNIILSSVNVQKRFYVNRNILSLKEREIWSDLFPREDVNGLADLLIGKPQTIYAGFDPTSASLHVGHLAVISALLQCQRSGHRVVAVVGEATAVVGDPTGKKSDRPELVAEDAAKNSSAIEKQLNKIFRNHEEHFWPDDFKKRFPLTPALILNNLEWHRSLSVPRFLHDVGRKLRMNELLSREAIKSRVAEGSSGMSLLEFAYQAVQAYDWLHMYRKYGCSVQIGGHDQMGNLVTGRDLVSRSENDPRVYGLTVPLITSEKGDKYGKTAGNAVWLDPNLTSTFELYQFLLRTPDADVVRLVKTLCLDPLPDLENGVLEQHRADPGKLCAHKKLADSVITLIHGPTGLESAKRTTEAFYSNSPAALCELSAEELRSAMCGSSAISLMLHPETTVLDLALRAKCFLHEVDARRVIMGGGFRLNHRKVLFPDAILIPGEHILPNGLTLARVGKRNHVLIHWLG